MLVVHVLLSIPVLQRHAGNCLRLLTSFYVVALEIRKSVLDFRILNFEPEKSFVGYGVPTALKIKRRWRKLFLYPFAFYLELRL